jgi:hypothetical protein
MTWPDGVPPLVYVGPTVTEQEVLSILPGAEICPPIRRGDLYRDRTLRYSAFVVLDGMFHQHEAVSIREIVDVLKDGAWVVGASSMGAIRAAECWPAGMEGVGSIYRLYRRGSLGSDDEVAVSFDPDDPRRSSVPLINIRYAVWRAVRYKQVDAEVGRRLVAIAADTHYPDRRWRHLLRNAAIEDEDRQLEGLLRGYDLKRGDAVAALRRVARRLSENPDLAYQPRRSTSPFVPAEAYRERLHSALDDLPEESVKPALARCILGSGRHRDIGVRWVENDGRDQLSRIADRIWDELARLGDLDAEIFRCRAVISASAEAARLGVVPAYVHRDLADREIARNHGCESWSELERQIDPGSQLWTCVLTYRDELAWAKCLRDALFRLGQPP